MKLNVWCLPQKVKESSDGYTEIVKNPWKCSSERSKRHQKAPGGAPRVPSMQHEAPQEGSGTPVARLFHEIDVLRGSLRPTPGTGRSQKHPKIMKKIDPETDVEKVLQKQCKSIRKYLQNQCQKRVFFWHRLFRVLAYIWKVFGLQVGAKLVVLGSQDPPQSL